MVGAGPRMIFPSRAAALPLVLFVHACSLPAYSNAVVFNRTRTGGKTQENKQGDHADDDHFSSGEETFWPTVATFLQTPDLGRLRQANRATGSAASIREELEKRGDKPDMYGEDGDPEEEGVFGAEWRKNNSNSTSPSPAPSTQSTQASFAEIFGLGQEDQDQEYHAGGGLQPPGMLMASYGSDSE
ncbi:unnamed protein product [Amoebophrya sp. A120]|nr:unnamed protein product [Amoebophrya sp. A120]|eukprot:GSA120T00021195001.1